MAKIEFYIGSAQHHIVVLDDGAVPRPKELINIRKITYRVKAVTWAIDGDPAVYRDEKLRANVTLEVFKEK